MALLCCPHCDEAYNPNLGHNCSNAPCGIKPWQSIPANFQFHQALERSTYRNGNPQVAIPESFSGPRDWNTVNMDAIINPPQHPMDRNYPHICFNPNCKKPLKWKEYVHSQGIFSNCPNLSIRGRKRYVVKIFERYKYYKKLWRSKLVKFLCCSCYNFFDPRILP